MAATNWIPGSFDPGVAHVLNRGAHAPRLVEYAEEPPPVLRDADDLVVRSAQSVPQLSVVIPVFNEAPNIRPLADEIRAALHSLVRYEVIFVDDGSHDLTASEVESCMGDGTVRLVRHHKRAGQSMALRTGVKSARARWVATLDGDGQNDPADLLAMYRTVSKEHGVGLVMGYRETRKDPWLKRVSSRVANRIRRGVLRDGCTDSGCGIKVFARDVFLDLPWFDHIHRFLPALFSTRGIEARFVRVRHRPRLHGVSKYGMWDRLWVGIADLAGVLWLQRRVREVPDAMEVRVR